MVTAAAQYNSSLFMLTVPDLFGGGGGVPGGVREGELLQSGGGLIWRGRIHPKHRLPGHGPKLIPPQPMHGGVGGGVHGDGEEGHDL